LEGFLIKPVSASLLFDTIMQAFGREVAEISKIAQRKEVQAEALGHIQGAHVLLVEDNEINQEVARELLEGAGLPVTIAANGEEAVDAVKENDFEAVLMDVQMPVMDGYQATKAIRNWEKNVRTQKIKDRNQDLSIPIIAMTAHAMTGDREKCLETGMDDYVSKPIDPEKLFSVLVRWIKPGKRAIPEYLIGRTPQEFQENESLPLSGIPGISIKSGLAKVRGNHTLYRKLLSKFHRNYQNVADDIKRALEEDDQETATRLAHTLKGLAGNIGAQSLHVAASGLEAALRQTQSEIIPICLHGFSESLKQVLDSIAGLELKDPDAVETQLSKQPVPVNRERVLSILGELGGYLKQDDFQAIKAMKSLKKELSAGMVEDELGHLEKYIEEYAFKDALEALAKVKQSLEKALKGNQNA